jgi:LysM repeat protein
VSRTSLYEVNDAEESTVIRPGDVICLPTFATMPPPPPTTPTSTPAADAPCASPYTVVAGDSWFQIARRTGVAMRVLLEANGAGIDTTLYPDAALCLPPGATPPAAARVETASTPVCAGLSYEVVTDDSWYLISRKASTSMTELLDLNDASDRTVLQPGDELCLPKGASVPVTSSGSLGALPVQGPCWFADSWHAPRGGVRRHEGLDIITERGKYVYAVADGILSGRAWDQPGLRAGNAWWLRSTDGSGTYYFYAHMSAFADDLHVGSTVKAGQIIGYVGATGNAGGPHLHFEVHPHGGAAINPYPLLKPVGACNRTTPYTQPGGWTPS